MHRLIALAAIVTANFFAAPSDLGAEKSRPIDRHALVARHNPVIRKPDCLSPLSVGNGEFVFTVDVTGLQTFPSLYEKGMPLCTQSQWGWHTQPNPAGYDVKDFPLTYYESSGRKLGLLYSRVKGRKAEVRWLRANPHRLHLGRIGLELRNRQGQELTPKQLTNIQQTLDLWSGIIDSRFQVDGQKVHVQTCCHPTKDLIAVRIESDLLRTGQLSVGFHFPYGMGSLGRDYQDWSKKTADWSRPNSHKTKMQQIGSNRFEFARTLDNDRYNIVVLCSRAATIAEPEKHKYILAAAFGTEPGRTHYYYVRPAFPDSAEIVQGIRATDYCWYRDGRRCHNYALSE